MPSTASPKSNQDPGPNDYPGPKDDPGPIWTPPPEIAPPELTPTKALGDDAKSPTTYLGFLAKTLQEHAKAVTRLLPRALMRSVRPFARVILKAFGRALDRSLPVADAAVNLREVFVEYTSGKERQRPILQAIQSLGIDTVKIIGSFLGTLVGEAIAIPLAAFLGFTGVAVLPFALIGGAFFAALGGLFGKWAALQVYDLTAPADGAPVHASSINQSASGSRKQLHPHVHPKPPKPPRRDSRKLRKPDLYLPPPGPPRFIPAAIHDDPPDAGGGVTTAASGAPPPPLPAASLQGVSLEVAISECSVRPAGAAESQALLETRRLMLKEADELRGERNS